MPRSPWGMPMLVALALLQGCIYITPDEFTEKKNSLDEDEDGATLGADCNDKDPLRFPENAEVPYDGIDQDCDPLLQDLLDIDLDGFAGIDKATYTAEHPDAPDWPTGLDENLVDCDDNDESVFPGATDSWYDGVDSNCDMKDDYDQDGDESVPDAYAAVSSWPAGDCDDTRADVGPNVTTDVWYNGVDEDCGKNNDFDADNDTYMPDSTATLTAVQLQKAYTDYVNYYGYDYQTFYGISSAARYGDCQDQESATWVEIVPEDIHPTAEETWYDGIDSNCDGINDFDADDDDYIRNEDIGAFDDWLAYWGYDNGTAGANDCNDLDAAVHPGTLEALSDSVDQDCDGDGDTTPWSDGDYEWNSVRPLVVGKNDLHYILTTAAETTDASTYKQPGLSLVFPLDSAAAQKPDAVVTWQNVTTTPNPLGEVIDMVMGTDSFYVATQYHFATSGTIYLIGKWVQWNASASSYSSKLEYNGFNASATGEKFYNDVDVQPEESSGKYWFLGCGAESMSFMRVDPFYSPAWNMDALGCDANSTGCQQFSGISADTCWLDVSGTTAQANLCNGTDCTTYDLDGLAETVTVAAVQPYDGFTWASVNRSGDWLVAVQSDGAVFLSDGASSYSVFSDDRYEAKYAEVAEDSTGRLYIAAVVADETGDGFEDVVLAYGDPSGTLTYVTVPLSDGTNSWHAEYAAVHVDDDRVMLAATGYYDGTCADSSGNCDTVSWMFYSPP